jgi:hypothetical protein
VAGAPIDPPLRAVDDPSGDRAGRRTELELCA